MQISSNLSSRSTRLMPQLQICEYLNAAPGIHSPMPCSPHTQIPSKPAASSAHTMRRPTICKYFNNTAAASTHLYRAYSGTASAHSPWAARAPPGNSKRKTVSSVQAAMRSWLWVIKIRPRRSFGRSRRIVISITANTRRLAGRKARRRSRREGRSRLAWCRSVGRVVTKCGMVRI
jgi:hypothetical protein